MKTCKKCLKAKPDHEFYPYLKNKTNLRPTCKECDNKESRAYYSKNRKARIIQYQNYLSKHLESVKETRRNYYKKHRAARIQSRKAHYHSERGYSFHLYKSIQTRLKHAKTYKNRKLYFTREEFFRWLEQSNFIELFHQWKERGFSQRMSPSVDRIDEAGDYRLDNIQLLTLGDNVRKYCRVLMAGKWSLGYEACKKCGGKDKKHHGGGLCKRCYNWASRRKLKAKECLNESLC